MLAAPHRGLPGPEQGHQRTELADPWWAGQAPEFRRDSCRHTWKPALSRWPGPKPQEPQGLFLASQEHRGTPPHFMGGGPCGASPQTTCIQTRTQTLRQVAFWAVTGEVPESPGDPASRISVLSASWEFLDRSPQTFYRGSPRAQSVRRVEIWTPGSSRHQGGVWGSRYQLQELRGLEPGPATPARSAHGTAGCASPSPSLPPHPDCREPDLSRGSLASAFVQRACDSSCLLNASLVICIRPGCPPAPRVAFSLKTARQEGKDCHLGLGLGGRLRWHLPESGTLPRLLPRPLNRSASHYR
ncbi:uncharacterized protein LOC116576724 [Mustela erminea]|uniref:uncharacterized protein LOC116576724 n=1 Tax=Mustela erminea TaxID=36723 RepID=UPI001387128F|nr:uncharacterized protein LOC116576724 [Mustela erminea]